MADIPLNSMWLAARPTLISGKIFKQKQSGAHLKLRMAHLFVKRSSTFMLAAPAWHYAQAAQHHTLRPAWQQWRVISGHDGSAVQPSAQKITDENHY